LIAEPVNGHHYLLSRRWQVGEGRFGGAPQAGMGRLGVERSGEIYAAAGEAGAEQDKRQDKSSGTAGEAKAHGREGGNMEAKLDQK
jgi:hypothetical protein